MIRDFRHHECMRIDEICMEHKMYSNKTTGYKNSCCTTLFLYATGDSCCATGDPTG
jgi:hypothetical protein